MTTYLSPHFSIEELTATSHRKLGNTPPPDVLDNLTITAKRLEGVRAVLGDRVISVSSGYRSPAVNKAVGGAKNSAHLTGHAIDFNCYSFGGPLAVCKAIAASNVKFDQLIEEGTWVHISFDPRMRRQVLTKTAGGYASGLAA